MPAARGTKRAASKASAPAPAASSAPKNKKKRGVVQLEIPTAPRNKGRVYTCGQGDVGQLGLGEDVPECTKFRHVTALGDKIVAVTAGGMHTIALDSAGKVWTYGCNDEGALGRNTSSDEDEGTPKKVTLPAKAVLITAGDSHSAALLENGDVYAWGSFRDSHGSMGLIMQGREGKSSKEPIKIDIRETAADIASGGDHLVILSTSGSVFTMGCGEQGQLGRLPQRSASREARHGFSALLVPSKVGLKAGASRVWAGYHATFVLDGSQEKVFAFGLNNYGQLGITGEKHKSAVYGPMECDAFRVSNGWSSIQAGQHHSLALDVNGQVYVVGRQEYGRLGLGDREGDAETLIAVPKLENKKCISISAGTCNSFAVADTGEVFSWGMGSEGQLGSGACADARAPLPALLHPAPARPPRARAVAAGGQHTVLLLDDPNPQKESTPAPDMETEEEKTDATTEEEEEEVDKEVEPPRSKRPKKEQEGEVTSTSASEVAEETKPQKLNGDEKKTLDMEVDETDNTQDTDSQDTTEDKSETKPEKMDTETIPDKPETTDTSSQETTDSETRSQETDKETETKEDKTDKPEINGESEKADIKSVDETVNPLVTSA